MHLNERTHRALVSALFVAGYYWDTSVFEPRLKAYGPAVRTEGTVFVSVVQKKGGRSPLFYGRRFLKAVAKVQTVATKC